jgi:hypothetical protein
MYKRLSNNLETTNHLSDCQHGYTKDRSTQTEILKLTNSIRKSSDSKLKIGIVFIDFQKAFDSIDHSILMKHISELGVKNKNLAWFQNYLTTNKYMKMGVETTFSYNSYS